MPTDTELLDLLGEALTPESREPNEDRVAALRDAVRESPPSASAKRPAGWRWVVAAVLGVAALVAAFLAGGALLDESEKAPVASSEEPAEATPETLEPTPETVAPTPEFETTLRSPQGDITAEVTVVKVGSGRTVHLRSDQLAALPGGEYYELWFVGEGDAPGKANRISAGTFTPDGSGRSDVELIAAVDLKKFPTMAVTVEPNDGKPAPSGDEVLRGEAT